jgi:hypothetical protein
MAEQPIIIKGGSVEIETPNLEFEDATGRKVGKKIKLKALTGKKGKITNVYVTPGDPPTVTITFDDTLGDPEP